MDLPSIDKIDDWVHAGYELLFLQERDPAGACENWLSAWDALVQIVDSEAIRSLDEFDEKFLGSDAAEDWVQELERELWNAGLDDSRYWERGIEFTTQYLARFAEERDLITENMRRALGTFHAALGQQEQADQLFRTWLQHDPEWGWGWIGWSDCFHLVRKERDLDRAERILLDGLQVAEVRDRFDLLDRLEILYTDQGRQQEAAEVHTKKNALRDHTNIGTEPLQRPTPAKSTKIGRNVPCPCGSGRKYKHCCGSMA